MKDKGDQGPDEHPLSLWCKTARSRSKTMKWLKDQKVENLLRKLGVRFETEAVPFPKIDTEEGLRRQARLVGKLNQDHVIQLALGMAELEAAFPMPVLNRPRSGLLWPWSGNHRLGAMALAFPEQCQQMMVDAYVTTVTDAQLMDILPRVLNTVESSLGFTKEERVAHARYLCAKHSISVQEAAHLFNIKPEWISMSARAEEVRESLLPDLGERVNGLARTSLMRLHTISSDKQVLRAAAKVAVDNDMSSDDVAHLISDVKKADTQLQKLSEIARWEKMLSKRTQEALSPAAKVVAQTSRKRFLDLLVRLEKVLSKAKTIEQIQCSAPADVDMVVGLWTRIERGMRLIFVSGKGGGK